MRRSAIFQLLVVLFFCAAAFSQPAQLKQVAIIDIPGRPGFDELVFANNHLIMTHQAAGTVEIFDLARRRLVAQVTGLNGPRALAASDKTGNVYIGNTEAQSITIISSKDWQVKEDIPVHASPYALAISVDGTKLYSANWRDRSITTVDFTAANRVSTFDLNGTPADLYLDPASGLLYVSLQDRAEVLVLNPQMQVIKRFPMNASQPTGLAGGNGRLFVSVRFAVLALDPNSGAELGRVAAPAGVDALWFDNVSGTLFAAGNNAVTIVNANDGFRAADEVRTDVKGHTLAFDPTRSYIYMPGGREGKSKLLILKRMQVEQQPEGQQVADRR